MKTHCQTGKSGEEIAVRYLKDRGYEILHRNWTCRWGEIDIVASSKGRIYFFEVKTRHRYVLESISVSKQKHLFRTIQIYLKRYGYAFSNFQVDFIGIETKSKQPRLTHLENMLEMRL